LTSSTDQAATPPQPGEPAAGNPASAAPEPGSRGNWAATAALVCGILGAVLATLPAGLILGVIGLRRARRTGRGRVRSWLAIVLTLSWAAVAAYLLPYNRVVDDVNDGAAPATLSRDATAAIREIDRARGDSTNADASRSLTALSRGLRTMVSDVEAGAGVPRDVLQALNHETGLTDGACGTVRL
jgi:hypothetical protein